jgi:predicted nucleotidyltransferase component of viral defense system
LERLLYRLSQSPHRDRFILKGAMLFVLWQGATHRPTRDLDLLGRGDNSVEEMVRVFGEICRQPVEEDGVVFLSESVRGERLRAEEEYQGVRILLDARQGSARLRLQIDVGFGDAVLPKPQRVVYPVLLEFPPPSLWAYCRETVFAEKFQAMVVLGMANSRMKDFWDLSVLARRFSFAGSELCRAVRATFERRRTEIPEQPPLALTSEFFADRSKERDWQAFLKRHKLEGDAIVLVQAASILRDFLMPPAQALSQGGPFEWNWPEGGPWTIAT